MVNWALGYLAVTSLLVPYLLGIYSLWFSFYLVHKKINWKNIILAETITFISTIGLQQLAAQVTLFSVLTFTLLALVISLVLHFIVLTFLFRLPRKDLVKITLL